MKTLTLMIGIPGSGKSTYADTLDAQLICIDDIKESIGVEFYTLWPDLSSNDKYKNVSASDAVAKTMCESLMRRGKNIVIDDNHLDQERILYWLDLSDKYSYQTIAIIMDEILDICISRRPQFSHDDIVNTHKKFLSLFNNKPLFNRMKEVIWNSKKRNK